MKGIVVYKSKTGFTKRYATWIANQLEWEMVSIEDFYNKSVEVYDCIIFGSRVHAGKVDGLKKVKALIRGNAKRKLIVFATGGTPIAVTDRINQIWEASFTSEELEQIPHFYMQSGLNYDEMGTTDRVIMKALARFLGKKEHKNQEDVGCEQAIGSSYDISDELYSEPLIAYVKQNREKWR